MPTHSCHHLLILASVSFAVLGCHSGDMPDIGRVHGKVTLNGQPMKDVVVSFEPVEGGRSAWALTDADGQYVLQYNGNTQGTKTGENLVRISSAKSPTYDDNRRVVDLGFKEKFPPEYNSESTQIVIVEGGNNEFNFDVVTDTN